MGSLSAVRRSAPDWPTEPMRPQAAMSAARNAARARPGKSRHRRFSLGPSYIHDDEPVDLTPRLRLPTPLPLPHQQPQRQRQRHRASPHNNDAPVSWPSARPCLLVDRIIPEEPHTFPALRENAGQERMKQTNIPSSSFRHDRSLALRHSLPLNSSPGPTPPPASRLPIHSSIPSPPCSSPDAKPTHPVHCIVQAPNTTDGSAYTASTMQCTKPTKPTTINTHRIRPHSPALPLAPSRPAAGVRASADPAAQTCPAPRGRGRGRPPLRLSPARDASGRVAGPARGRSALSPQPQFAADAPVPACHTPPLDPATADTTAGEPLTPRWSVLLKLTPQQTWIGFPDAGRSDGLALRFPPKRADAGQHWRLARAMAFRQQQVAAMPRLGCPLVPGTGRTSTSSLSLRRLRGSYVRVPCRGSPRTAHQAPSQARSVKRLVHEAFAPFGFSPAAPPQLSPPPPPPRRAFDASLHQAPCDLAMLLAYGRAAPASRRKPPLIGSTPVAGSSGTAINEQKTCVRSFELAFTNA